MSDNKPVTVPLSKDQLLREGDKTLVERGSIYGPYQDGVDIRTNIMLAVTNGYKAQHGRPMPLKYREYFWDISNKLCRLAVCPNHEDSWNDIRGYAKLIHNAVIESGDYK